MIEFVATDPDALPPEALKWLQVSLDKTPGGNLPLLDVLDRGRKGEGTFYIVKSDENPIGCVYLEWADDALNVALLGGDYIKGWRDEMHDFCVSLIRQRGIKNIFFVGRYGLGKLFPQFKCIGMLYAYSDNGG